MPRLMRPPEDGGATIEEPILPRAVDEPFPIVVVGADTTDIMPLVGDEPIPIEVAVVGLRVGTPDG